MTKWTQGAECAVDGSHIGLTKGTMYNAEIVGLVSTGKYPFQAEPKTATLLITATVRDMTGQPRTQTWTHPKPIRIEKLKPRLLTGDY